MQEYQSSFKLLFQTLLWIWVVLSKIFLNKTLNLNITNIFNVIETDIRPIFNIYFKCTSTILYSRFLELIHFTELKFYTHWTSLQSMENTILQSVSTILTILDTLYKWGYAVLILLWLAFFHSAECHSIIFMLLCYDRISYFLMLNNISLNVYTRFSLCIHLLINVSCFRIFVVV